ncbi:sialate O-acetylesterase-like isoform X2 [Gigantopelta aegis]|uniref:sialate O-acetylesterase-like isoform X2 n=1 Tax=Gigantopelta aegis TaxID=1735272 RepID=UPI001B88B042|nr:sialate O-acetylesterase-like isoform X2 [Gigantopelta aegis]
MLVYCILLCSILSAVSEIRFASYYGSHMVLQRAPNRAVVWGTASKIGDTVTVAVSGQGHQTTKVVKNPEGSGGFWKATLPAISEKGPFSVTVTSSEGQQSLDDVLFGDVWICSGQSNMDFSMSQILDSKAEIAKTLTFKDIRIFRASKVESKTPYEDLHGIATKWTAPTNESIPSFSAVCFLFAENVYPHLNYPIGLVQSSWGGTPIQAWSSPDAIRKCPSQQTDSPGDPSVLWNAMMNPLKRMTIYGALWYQGEANAGSEASAELYACQFPAMINDWRSKFNKATDGETSQHFPFGFVQLAPWEKDPTKVGGFPALRWSQTVKHGYVPNNKMADTFMAVAMDLPDFDSPYGSIHPRDKQDVAYRLALSGRAVAYSQSVQFQGPFPSSFEDQKEKNYLKIIYDHSPIEIKNRQGFEVCCGAKSTDTCGEKDKWHAAPIEHYDDMTVTISSSACAKDYIVGLRYEWRTSPCEFKMCSVYGLDTTLPAPPFIANKIA